MESNRIFVNVVLRCTDARLTNFFIANLSDAPIVGDKIALFSYDGQDDLSAEVVGREICYQEEVQGVRQPYSVSLYVVFPLEKWLYLWQDIVEMYRDNADTKKAIRKSDRFLTKNAKTSSVEFLVWHNDVGRMGLRLQFLLEHYQSFFVPVKPVVFPLACIRLRREDNRRHLSFGIGDGGLVCPIIM